MFMKIKVFSPDSSISLLITFLKNKLQSTATEIRKNVSQKKI